MSLLIDILFGKQPPVRVREGWDDLYDEGGTMSTLDIGRQGSGKTSSLARRTTDYFLRHEDEAIFVLDWSGSITDSILTQLLQLSEEESEKVLRRVVYDELGNPDWVVPLPEFSLMYGPLDEQVDRVVKNIEKSNPDLKKHTPVVGGLAMENAVHFFRLCTAITNSYGETWQITEAKKLLVDEGLLRLALNKFGGNVPEAKYFLEKVFLEKRDSDKQLSVYALVSILNAVEPREMRARFGYYKPGWTPKEAIEKGLMVIVNGANLITQEKSQGHAFTQAFSLILQEVKRRIPGNPNDKPITLILDETYGLIGIQGIAADIGQLPSQYRSRKLKLSIVIQSLSQLAPPLDEQIWSLGNKVVYAVENKNEAEKIAHQLFKYDPRYVKQPARNTNQNNITEPETGQDRIVADWIQNLKFRECLIRRFKSERELDPMVCHVPQTRPLPTRPPLKPLWEIKEQKLRERGVPVRDALEVINQRKIESERRGPPQV